MKRIIPIFMLLLLLVGCGGKTDDVALTPDEDTPSVQETKQEAETEQEVEQVDENAAVTPELKEFLDSYEAFMDGYIAFMASYQNAEDPLTMLGEYAEVMQDYADFMEKVNAYDTAEMSVADTAYYLEVSSRVTQKLLRSLPEN